MIKPAKLPLLVFDLDGTLAIFKPKISPLWLALKEIAPEKAAEKDALTRIAAIPKGGRLDTDIVMDVLELFNLSIELFQQYSEVFLEIYVQNMTETPYLMCGEIREVLQAAKDQGLTLSILTGNFKQTAYAKLQRAQINEFFSVGAFGGDKSRRSDLLPLLLKRLGLAYSSETLHRTFIIGDTPHDLKVARIHGARAVAVAEGPYSAKDLAFYEPDLLLEKWSGAADLKKIINLI